MKKTKQNICTFSKSLFAFITKFPMINTTGNGDQSNGGQYTDNNKSYHPSTLAKKENFNLIYNKLVNIQVCREIKSYSYTKYTKFNKFNHLRPVSIAFF